MTRFSVEARNRFKEYINTLATIKTEEVRFVVDLEFPRGVRAFGVYVYT